MKKFMQLLLSKFYSKKENELVGHQGTLDNTRCYSLAENLQAGSEWQYDIFKYCPPYDGYLNVSCRNASENGEANSMIQVNYTGVVQVSQVSSTALQGHNLLVPVLKGVEVHVNGLRMKEITVRYFPNAGGGVLEGFSEEVCYA